MKNIRHHIITFIVCSFLLGWLLLCFRTFQHEQLLGPPLAGYIHKAPGPALNQRTWFDGSYQTRKELYLNENFPFRNFAIRLSNQISYSVFHKVRSGEGIMGKNDYLFQSYYLNSYYGRDFLGEEKLRRRFDRLAYLRDTLATMGKDVIFVIAPSKAYYYSENIPDDWKGEKLPTNYERSMYYMQQHHINYVDFNAMFVKMRKQSKYPLFPQYGIHWSEYGAFLAADSLIRFVEGVRKIDMPNIHSSGVEMAQPKMHDYDFGHGLNLLMKLPTFDMAYPKVTIEDTLGKKRPRLLLITDSFYEEMLDNDFSKAFSNCYFQRYNCRLFNEQNQQITDRKEQQLEKQIADHDVIIIMSSEANLRNIGWGFIPEASRLYGYPEHGR